eukprot:CAMPEP_0173236764 /NCGR_PEP_ID=MMETSP1142-20121109/11641_1 /TAXON_ID=483371 /ORGANISM="non described non described, Strain CCMP2298" /LENGTH=48 /DNA_ID= /DNA_START= /DNA_END= /DNA_ORIENTATION=
MASSNGTCTSAPPAVSPMRLLVWNLDRTSASSVCTMPLTNASGSSRYC